MTTDQAFLSLPETETFNVFRIEKFQVVPWNEPGVFYTGDSYIVLKAVKVGTSNRVQRDIYFWLGEESTQDEQGTAAIKTVELDDRFGGEPTQHREVQGHESKEFVDIFDVHGGLRYLDGGIESGFRKPTGTEPHTMLFHIKGKRAPVLQQVKPVGASLNQGDAFILITADSIFLWVGKGANIMEKNKASQILDKFRASFPKHKNVRLDGGATSPEFWAALGGECPIKDASAGGADDAHEAANVLQIYEINGDDFKLIAEKNAAKKDVLKGDKQFLIHRGESIVVFNGSGVSQDVAKNSIQVGLKFMTQKKLPTYTSIATAREGKPSGALDLIFA